MKLKGVVYFHFETGTEGGHWAFQDEKFMNLDPPNHWHCKICGRIWDKDKVKEEPPPSFSYLRPQVEEYIEKEKATYRHWVDDNATELPPGKIHWAYRGYDQPMAFAINKESHDITSAADVHFNEVSNETSLKCFNEGHKWTLPKEQYPNGVWSYNGTHILQDGDYLKIYDQTDTDQVVWEGIIDLKPYDVFTQEVYGMWIHTDQKGIDRNVWAKFFFQENPAELTKGKIKMGTFTFSFSLQKNVFKWHWIPKAEYKSWDVKDRSGNYKAKYFTLSWLCGYFSWDNDRG